AGPVQLMLYEAELARARAPRGVNVIGTGWGGAALLRHGTPEQRQRLLPPIPAGDEIWCQLFSEPGAGSDLASLTTRATSAERVGLSAGEGTLWGQGPTFADVLALWRGRRDAGLLPPGDAGAALRDEMARLHIEGEALRMTGLRLLSAVARGEVPAAEMSVRKLASDLWGQQVHDAVWQLLGVEAQLGPGEPRAVGEGAW